MTWFVFDENGERLGLYLDMTTGQYSTNVWYVAEDGSLQCANPADVRLSTRPLLPS